MSTDAAGSTRVPGADASPGQGTGAWAGGQPLIIPGLFRKPAFTGGLVSGLAFFTAGSHDGETGT